jgi:nifR3 family TIM-barrel protein
MGAGPIVGERVTRSALPWFEDGFPVYLAPMAGVTDSIFRGFCKGLGADVVVTEFVSAEGIFRKNARTLQYLAFEAAERPVGVQLFGADPDHLAEAARIAVEWKQPDFIDLNFGCPVNKVVCKNGGSSLLRDCPLLERVAAAVVRAVDPVPVTAKIRIGWDARSINAVETARILEGTGIAAIAVHGRTKEQGYGGVADWETIGRVAHSVGIPVIGNGDIDSAATLERRRRESGIRGAMIGRAAMCHPWIFREIRAHREGAPPSPPSPEEQWAFIREHCRRRIEAAGHEGHAMASMRARLMAYSRGMRDAKMLRTAFAAVASLAELDAIAARHLEGLAAEPAPPAC